LASFLPKLTTFLPEKLLNEVACFARVFQGFTNFMIFATYLQKLTEYRLTFYE